LQLASARAEASAEQKRTALARRRGEEAEAQIAESQTVKIQAQIDLLEYKVSQAQIRSATTGVVILGDLERQLGAPFKTGDLLFEVTPLNNLRAEIAVPEDQIADIQLDQKGRLASASLPGDLLPFTIEHINPVAEIADGRNVFKVRVRLGESRAWLRPGMAGTAKIDVDRRSYLRIWTRRFVNWVRMQLWW
jgi:multidrug resistance efflux pump